MDGANPVHLKRHCGKGSQNIRLNHRPENRRGIVTATEDTLKTCILGKKEKL